MKLLTKAIEKKLPKLNEQEGLGENAIVYCKFFDPFGSYTWFVLKGERIENDDFEFFGIISDGSMFEYGYFRLKDLESLKFFGKPRIERDLYFKPKALKEAKEEFAKSHGVKLAI